MLIFQGVYFFMLNQMDGSWIQASSNSTWEGDLGGEKLTARGW